MKRIFIILLLLSPLFVLSQSKYNILEDTTIEFNCFVAHVNKNGVFHCNLKGTFYPDLIYDSTIRKWFIKIVNGDSLFYYRHDYIRTYVWKEHWGYAYEPIEGIGLYLTMPHIYGDTLIRKEQYWDDETEKTRDL